MIDVTHLVAFALGGIASLCLLGLIVLVERCIYWRWTRGESE